MAAENHPIAAGAFLTLVLTGMGALVIGKLQNPTAAAAHGERAAPPSLSVAEQIRTAISIGDEGDIQMAARLLAGIVKENPQNIDALFNLGVALGGMDRNEDAEKVFARILELSPNDQEAMAERATLLLALGRVAEAFALADRIPPGAGQLKLRLEEDPRWLMAAQDPRLAALRARHGLSERVATGSTAVAP